VRFFLSVLVVATGLGACGHPADRVPPGYADACWGGRDNYPRNVAFTDRRLAVTVDATEENWPLLKRIVKDVAAEHGLQVFDLSESGPHLRAVLVDACAASGILVNLDKRIRPSQPQSEPEFLRGKVVVALYTYKPEAPFEPVSDALVKKLRAAWKEHAKVERFPALLPSQKALPDEVRRQLVQECRAAEVPKPFYCEGL
jgi:hypothetical protein